jgi:hypothetical protein
MCFRLDTMTDEEIDIELRRRGINTEIIFERSLTKVLNAVRLARVMNKLNQDPTFSFFQENDLPGIGSREDTN